jgi:hypothetical protein
MALGVGGIGCVRAHLPLVSWSGGLKADGDAPEQCGVRTGCGESDADASGGLGDACCDLQQAHPQGGELGGGERMRRGDGVAHRQHQPIGGGVQHETHLIGECRTATGAVGGKLALVQMGLPTILASEKDSGAVTPRSAGTVGAVTALDMVCLLGIRDAARPD